MLKTVLETLDGLDEAVAKLYIETDGKHILQIEGVDAHPDVANLKSAYERVKSDKVTLAQERDAFKEKLSSLPDDFDAEKWSKLKDGKADEAALIKVRQEMEQQISEWKGKAEESQSKLSRFAVERDLSDALIAAGITDPGLQKGARAMLSGQVKTSDDGAAIVESDMGPIGLTDYVKKWSASEGKAFVTAASGGGRKGGNDGTVEKKWSEMTSAEKVALNRENPEAYQKAKQAAA